MPSDYLLKTEPSEYSFADLQRDKATEWDGVSNPVALKNIRAMTPGDRLIIYETGEHKSVVGTASVVSVDPSNTQNQGRKSDHQAHLLGTNQIQQALPGFAVGSNRPPFCRSTYRSPIQISSWRLIFQTRV